MSAVTDHYERLLAAHYSWMRGDFAAAVADQRALLERLGVAPGVGGRALDLGCGPGAQSIALADLGYAVTAVDTSPALLNELERRGGDRPITTVLADLRRLTDFAAGDLDVIVCMGDTLTHLETLSDVTRLCGAVYHLLAPGGIFVTTFRDLSEPLTGLDRFIPVRQDADRIMLCFLEYHERQADTVIVHDLLYDNRDGGWTLRKSCYPKLRLGAAWVAGQLEEAGLAVSHHERHAGMVTLRARR